MNKFISYGFTKDKYDPKKVALRNDIRRGVYMKPYGGLWACQMFNGNKRTWKDFCKEEDFNLKSLKESFIFSIKDNAKIFIVKSMKELNYLVQKYGNKVKLDFYTEGFQIHIDYEKFKKDYDAIYFTEPTGNWMEMYNNYFYGQIGVDVESICILNPDIIVY